MSDADSKCNLYHKNDTGQNSSIFHIQNPYGGIPQNLLTNLIGVGILVSLFLIMRKSAWKALNQIVHKHDVDHWTDIFFSFTNAVSSITEGNKRKQSDVIDPTEGGFEAIKEDDDTEDASGHVTYQEPLEHGDDAIIRSESMHRRPPEVTEAGEPVSMVSTRSLSIVGEGTFWEWFKSIFTLPDEDIEDIYGEDALQYLRFQRYVIGYLIFVMVICVSVILPLNFMGELQGDETSFGHTTLANLSANEEVLWAHVTLSFLLFPVAILVMRRFSLNVQFQEIGLEMSKTLMIEKVPKVMCKEEELKRHFNEAYPDDVRIRKITFSYDVLKLQNIHQELKDAKIALKYCNKHNVLDKKEFYVYRAHCSRFCSCFCCCCSAKLEATEFYRDEVDSLTQKFLDEREMSLKQPVGIVFITFQTINNAKEVFDSFRRSVLQCNFEPPESSLSSILKPAAWKVSFATTPDDIYWENLNVSRRFLTLKYIAINVALFFTAFFLTTPEYLVSQTDWLVQFFGKTLQLPGPIIDFLPTVLLWSFTALLPLLVSYSDRWLGHYTRSDENHSIMKKTFWYLLFMVVFLPTFGFTTAQASIEFLFNTDKNETYRWDCIFLPDSGAFFVNYVITAALVGCGLELIRFPEMFWYMIQICWSRSQADTPAIQRSIRYEFRFGEQYARMMLLFCMTVMFSVSCPLITPFGCLYFITKHYVDRHNIFYVYKPSKISKRVHATAISFVILSTVVLQFFMTIFSVVRSGAGINDLSLRSKYAIALFLISVNIFSAQLWSETCKKFSPIEYMECTLVREQDLNKPEFEYLPDILKDGYVRPRLFSPISEGIPETSAAQVNQISETPKKDSKEETSPIMKESDSNSSDQDPSYGTFLDQEQVHVHIDREQD